jgi:hypothetical protein
VVLASALFYKQAYVRNIFTPLENLAVCLVGCVIHSEIWYRLSEWIAPQHTTDNPIYPVPAP